MARPQRVLPRRRSGVPHVLHQQPRRRGDGDHVELPRHYAARPSGDLGGLARGLPPDAAVQVVELARQLRHRGLAGPEVGQGVRRWRSRLPKARRRGESELKKRDHFAAFEQPGLSVQELREGSAESAEPVLRSTDTRFCAKSQLSRFAVWKARKDAFWASGRQTGSCPGWADRLVWSGSGLKSTWMENAHFVEVERHPLYTRVREIFLKRGRELAVTVWDSNQ